MHRPQRAAPPADEWRCFGIATLVDVESTAIGERLLKWIAPLASEEGSYDEKHNGFHLADQGHETCWLIRSEEKQFTLSRMSRGNGWRFRMSSPFSDDVEKYLVEQFGPELRATLLPGAARVSARQPWDAISGWGPPGAGFTLQPAPIGQHLRSAADPSCPDSRTITFAHEDDAIAFSRYAASSVDDLKRSYLDEQGEPLLPTRR